LGTPPEKDVGFPYPDSWGDASDAVTAEMASFAWQRHLIEHGLYADWVDRGRLRPTHRQWSAYLREVAEKAEAEIVRGEVVGLDVDDEQWQLALDAGETITADGVVFTGAGTPITVAGQPQQHARVFDGRSYWLRGRTLRADLPQSTCVIGSGETAASVVIDLLKHGHKRSTVDVVTSRGVIYSRGESYDANRFYSDPGDWPRLAESHRREFLERTDRGVFSPQAEAILNQSRAFRTLAGRRWRSRPASDRSSSRSSTGTSASESPMTSSSSRSASMLDGSRRCSAAKPAGDSKLRSPARTSSGASRSICRSAA
jgi:mycobactin lysine-N-oxygenase